MIRKRRAVVYARYSPRPKAKAKPGTKAQDCESIEWQFERLDAFCTSLDLEIVARYSDKLKSGKSTEGRDGLEEAILHAIRVKGVLVVYDFSRLSRDVVDSFLILRRLRKGKAELRSLLDGVATDTATGDMYFTILAAFNQLTRRMIAEKTSDSMLRHQYNGKRRMTRPDRCPFGYGPGVDAAALLPIAEEQVIIERIKALSLEGLHARAICRRLDEEGLERRGKNWQEAHNLVAAILARG